MESLKIRIQTLESAKVQRKIMPEIDDAKVMTAKDLTVCILEDMTKEHKAGISLVFEMSDGTHVVFNTTENLFNGVIASYTGALARFGDLREIRKSGGTIAPDNLEQSKEV